MKHYEIKVDEKMIYIGQRDEDFGKKVLVQDFQVFWCTPTNKKSHLKCTASIVIDGVVSTSCSLDELIPIKD